MYGRVHSFCLALATWTSVFSSASGKLYLKAGSVLRTHTHTCVSHTDTGSHFVSCRLTPTETLAHSCRAFFFYSCSAAGRPTLCPGSDDDFSRVFVSFFTCYSCSCSALPRSLAFCLTWGRFHFLAGSWLTRRQLQRQHQCHQQHATSIANFLALSE